MINFNMMLALGTIQLFGLGLVVLLGWSQVRSLNYCITQRGFSQYIPACRRIMRQRLLMRVISWIFTLLWLFWCVGWIESLATIAAYPSLY